MRTQARGEAGRRGRARAMAMALLAVLTAFAVAACGSSSSSSASKSASATSSSSSSGSSAAASAPSSSSCPGKGKPALTLGTKNFTEEYVVGALYELELKHDCYTVNYKPNIGATEIVDKALTSGQIDAYPEYTGESYATVFGKTAPVKSPEAEYQIVRQLYAKRGQSVSNFTPFQDVDALASLKTYASTHGLHAIPDLKKLSHFVLGARPEFAGRYEGVVGLQKVYGLHNFTFKSLALGLQYDAMNSGAVQVADVFTTDPQLASGKYAILSDTKHIFGFQNIILVINTSKLKALGGQTFLNIINNVNAKLTTPAVIAMNRAVAVDKDSPQAVAQAFLKANGLL